MTAKSAEKLYTPKILGLAMELAKYPFDPTMPHSGQARSKSCGSTLKISLNCRRTHSIESVGLQVAACAIGQASAAIFARHVIGTDATAINAALQEIELWLTGQGQTPSWPDIGMLESASAYPARHGAILLPWRAAAQALSNADTAR